MMNDIQTIILVGAFLKWQDEVLLMQRGKHRSLGPGLWAGIGGHIEQSEMASPLTACLREIEEETGISSTQIETLQLRYFTLLKHENALHSIYYFSGTLKEKPTLHETSEGKLYWIKLKDGIDLDMAAFMKSFYLHWINNISDTSLHCFLDSDIHLLA